MSEAPPPSRLKRLGRLGLRALTLLRRGLVVALALALGFLVWLIATESGLRNALALAQQFSGGAVTVASAEGRLLTPLRLHGFKLRTPGVQVDIEDVDMRLDLAQLPHRILVVKSLAASGVTVGLGPPAADEEAPPASGPPDLRLPFGVFVRQASLDALQIRDADGGELFALRHGELRGHWNRDAIAIETLRLSHDEYGELVAELKATALADGLRIEALRLSGPGEVSATGRIGLAATADNDLELRWQALQWPLRGDPLITSPDGRLKARGTWTALEFDAGLGLGPEARITAQGHWSPDSIDARLAWTALSDPRDPAASIWHSRRGALRVQGVPTDYGFTLQGELVAREIPGRIEVTGRGDLAHLRLDDFLLEALNGSLHAVGEVAWRPAVRGRLSLRAERLDPSALVSGWPGSLNGTAQADFDLSGDAPDVRFEIAVDDSRLRERALALNAHGRYAKNALQIERLELASGRTTVTAAGQATPPFALSAQIDSPNLEALWPGLAGHAQATVSLKGKLPVPQAEIQGRLGDIAYLGYRLADAQVDVRVDPVNPMRIRVDASGIEAGQTIDRARLSLDGPVADHRLELDMDTPRGQLSAALQGRLEPREPRWSGRLQTLTLAPKGIAPWSLESPAELSLAADQAEIGSACLGGEGGRACLQGRYTPQQSEASLQLTRFALEYLRPLLPDAVGARGELSGEASLTVSGRRLRQANIDIQTSELGLRAGSSLVRLLPSHLVMRENADEGLDADIRLNLSEGAILLKARAATGEVLQARPLSGTLHISVPDLAVLQRVSPEIGEAQGSVEGEFSLGGTLGLPRVDGDIAVADGRIRLETPGILLSELKASASGSSAGRVHLEASAKSGKGHLAVRGDIDFSAKPLVADVHIGGQHFQAANTPVAKVWVDPDLDIRLDRDGLDVSGQVGVPQALITPERFKGSSAVSPSSDQVIVDADGSEPKPAMPVRAEVTVRLGDKVRFEGYGLKSRFEGALTVVEQPGRLTAARGQVNMAEGQYKAYGQELTIETGRLIYSGGPVVDPALELRAKRQPREDVTVGVIVRGTLDQPQFNLYSEPSMTQQEQLSWLVLGRPLSGGAGDDAALANAALSLGLKGGQWFAQKIGGDIGLDEVSIGSEAGQTAEQAQLTIGKYLSPKLYVGYGVSLFQPGHTFKMRYDLGKGFAVETESGVYSGGDLLYSIEK